MPEQKTFGIEDIGKDYKYGFRDPEKHFFKSKRGLSREVVEEISWMKNEPEWMRKFRLKAYEIFLSKPTPTWGSPLLLTVDYDNMFYYIKPTDKQSTSWEDVPEDIKKTYERLGIPEAERKFLGGVTAQYESEVVYHSIRADLTKQGIIFSDMDTGLREYPEIVKKYFSTVIPASETNTVQIRPQNRIITPGMADGYNDQLDVLFQIQSDRGNHVKSRFSVYSLSGVMLYEDDNLAESLSNGWHKYSWDGRDEGGNLFPSGLYIYLLTVNGETKKGTFVIAR